MSGHECGYGCPGVEHPGPSTAQGLVTLGLMVGFVTVCAIIGVQWATTPAPADPAPAPAVDVQLPMLEPIEAPTLEPRDTYTVTPAPVPAPVPAPRPVTVGCVDGLLMAEDGSCVPPSFWDDATDLTGGLPPCEQEDSIGCYWDASIRGNGLGRSFTVDICGVLVYWDNGEIRYPDAREGYGC